MNFCRLLGIVTILLLTGASGVAQNAPKAENAKSPPATTSKPANKVEANELAAIRQASDEFVKAFNAGDATAVAALWTKDGDYTDESGKVFAGREAIEKAYAAFFATNPQVKIRVVVDSLRLLSPDAAVEDGRVILESASASETGLTKYMAVHVKVDGRWLMSTVRDSVSAVAAARPLDDLEWLIGAWTSEDYGSTTESVCRWVANKSFVERTYVVTNPDQTTASGIQIIGYNPQGDHLQSWSFTSDGGFAVGVWSPRENGWAAEIRGTTGDGIGTTAVNLLTKLDDNAYSWRSVSRTAGGVALPDTHEVVIKRKATSR